MRAGPQSSGVAKRTMFLAHHGREKYSVFSFQYSVLYNQSGRALRLVSTYSTCCGKNASTKNSEFRRPKSERNPNSEFAQRFDTGLTQRRKDAEKQKSKGK